MKKILLFLFIAILLARIPIAKWNELPDKTKFLKDIAAFACDKYDCNKATVGYMVVGEEALIFFDCLDKKGFDI